MIAPEHAAAQLAEIDSTRESFDSLFDEAKHAVCVLRGDRRLSYRATQAALLITLYSREPILYLPAKLLTSLTEIDEMMTLWRHRHSLLVHRMLGIKMGTGGSSGYHYLRATAERHKVRDKECSACHAHSVEVKTRVGRSWAINFGTPVCPSTRRCFPTCSTCLPSSFLLTCYPRCLRACSMRSRSAGAAQGPAACPPRAQLRTSR